MSDGNDGPHPDTVDQVNTHLGTRSFTGEGEHPLPEQVAAFARGELTGDDEAAVERHLLACDRCAALLGGLADDPFVAALRRANRAPTVGNRDPLPTDPTGKGHSPAPTVPGYELLGELGRGAMGVVYKARHLQLNRLAAIKMIVGGRYHDPAARLRFAIEAEAVAALDHPNVVHVHEFGAHEELPFFALEYVDGGSLAEKLARDGKPTPRAAAELIVKLAEGVAAAHTKGIVHRDLKPANILLTASGAPKVADFGLAKVGGSDLTATGAVMGTPSYMSPEQAAGRTRDVGTPSDVYALGAILYELLTGRPPFKGDSVMDTLEQVRTREPVRPRAADSAVPRDLETICLKCLQKDPAHRYGAATELGADLRAYLEGRPISARPTKAAERAWKWVRRNKVVAGLLAAVAGSLVAGSVTSVWFGLASEASANQSRADKQTADTKTEEALAREQEAKEATTRAEEALKLKAEQERLTVRAKDDARNALDRMTSFVVDELLAKKPTLTAEDQKYLRDALRTYEGFAANSGPGDEASRAGVARAYLRVGTINHRLGAHTEAIAAYSRAAELLGALATDFPAHRAEYVAERSVTQVDLGVLFQEIGDPARSDEAYRRAEEFRSDAMRARPDDPAGRAALGKIRSNIGLAHAHRGDFPKAITAFRSALDLLRTEKPADEGAFLYERGGILNNLGETLLQSGDLRGAENVLKEGLALIRKLADEAPRDVRFMKMLANLRGNLGLALLHTERLNPAETELTEALRLRRQLVAELPGVPEYRHDLAAALQNSGELCEARDRHGDAEKHLREALALRRALATDPRATPEHLDKLAETLTQLGMVLLHTGRQPKEAEECLQEALKMRRKLIADQPRVARHREELAGCLDRIGAVLGETGKPEAARTAYLEARELLDKLRTDFPGVAPYPIRLGGVLINLGHLEGDDFDAKSALGRFDEAVTVLEKVMSGGERPPNGIEFLREAYWGRAVTLQKLERYTDALKEMDKAMHEQFGRPPTPMLMDWALILARAGKTQEAFAAADALAGKDKKVPPDKLYDLARVCAVAAAKATDDKTLATKANDRAAELLGKARALGYFRDPAVAEKFKSDPDFDAVRDRLGKLEPGKPPMKK